MPAELQQSSSFIGIAGNIGVGKTTFTEKLALEFGWKAYYESVIDNPYLSDFYRDMKRWSFNLQIYFLHHRFATHMAMSKNISGAIQDRTIYEDVEIFARNLYDMNYMSERDWNTYRELFKNMESFLPNPDLIIYLKASTDTLISRINQRDREFERNINSEYLHSLNISYDRWIGKLDDKKVLVLKTDDFNIYQDKTTFKGYCHSIREKLVGVV